MYKIGKEERKLSIFTDDTILYVDNPKEHTNKLLELKMVSQGCHLESIYKNLLYFCMPTIEYKII